MLARALLRASAHLEGDRIVPHYFSARDELWLGALLAEYRRFVGQKQAELHERLREPLPVRAPRAKLRIAIAVLDAACRAPMSSPVPPKEVRAALFRAAAGQAEHAAVVQSVAASFGLTEGELESALFADLPSERRVAELPPELSAAQVAADANLSIVTTLIRRAVHVRVVARGNARALVRRARLAGLICKVSRAPHPVNGDPESEALSLDISGPFSLFQHSDRYGRALASLIPHLARCSEFELSAECALGRAVQLSSLVLRSGDPIATHRELTCDPPRIEQSFARDFARLAPAWQLVRDPPPRMLGERLIFPDFELVHREHEQRRFLLEIVGFWTQKYVQEKLTALREAGIQNLLLCVDQNRHCAEDELPPDVRIVRYKRRIDPRTVLAIIDSDVGAAPHSVALGPPKQVR